jgi:hypothetical protein
VKKKCQKKRRKNAENKSVEKVKKESVGKKGVRSDCWYAQVFEPSYKLCNQVAIIILVQFC